MLQTKFILGTDVPDLERSVNDFLSTLSTESVCKYFPDNCLVVVEYQIHEEYKVSLCCECSLWDSQNRSNLFGFCQLTGDRKRFSCKACPSYKDIRG